MNIPRIFRGLPRIPPGVWLTLVFITGVMLMLVASVNLSPASSWVPRVVLTITLFLLLLQLAQEWINSSRVSTVISSAPESGKAVRTMAAVGWLGLLLMLTWIFGVATGSTLFCLAWLRLHAAESWWVSVSMAGGLGLALWLFFSTVLGVSLHSGLF